MNMILCEKAYFESSWCKQILTGLKGELKKRRIPYKVVFHLEATEDSYFVIGSDYQWMASAVSKLNAKQVTPIVIFNQLNHILPGTYHSVSSDVGGSVTALIRWLKSKNKQNICLYGVNPKSISDISRSQSYTKTFEMGKIFYNSGSLKQCFLDFANCEETFDAVICTNDFAAISLVKNLRELHDDKFQNLEIISCSETSISACFTDVIKSVNINLTSLGTNAYQVLRASLKGENISEISITVKWDMEFRTEPIIISKDEETDVPDHFYMDKELSDLMYIDKLIEKCDDTDKQILRLLLSGDTYFDIAEACHIAEQSVKYRVKQYIEICRLKNRKELIGLLKEYHIKV